MPIDCDGAPLAKEISHGIATVDPAGDTQGEDIAAVIPAAFARLPRGIPP